MGTSDNENNSDNDDDNEPIEPILHPLLYIVIDMISNDKLKGENDNKNENIKSQQIMYSCHIERLYSDLVIVHNRNNNNKLNIIRINDNSLLPTIIILGQTVNNKLQIQKNKSNNLIRNDLINNLICILVE